MNMWVTLGYDGEKGKVSFVILTFDKLKEKEGMEGMGVQMKVKKVLFRKMEIRPFSWFAYNLFRRVDHRAECYGI